MKVSPSALRSLTEDALEMHEWASELIAEIAPGGAASAADTEEISRRLEAHGLFEAVGTDPERLVGAAIALGASPVQCPLAESSVVPAFIDGALTAGEADASPTRLSRIAVDPTSIAASSSLGGAEPLGPEWSQEAGVSAVLRSIPWAAVSDGIVLGARDAGGALALLLVDLSRPGVRVVEREVLTSSFPIADVHLEQVPCTVLVRDARATREADRLLGLLQLTTSALLLGAMSAALDTARAHAVVRHQFGRPVGSFQAIQHLLVDMWQSTFMLSAACVAACDRPDAGEPDPAASATAKALASELATSCVETGIQVLGGVGFTEEFGLGVHLRRAMALGPLFGDMATIGARLVARDIRRAAE